MILQPWLPQTELTVLIFQSMNYNQQCKGYFVKLFCKINDYYLHAIYNIILDYKERAAQV
jgi:hypothetical protein